MLRKWCNCLIPHESTRLQKIHVTFCIWHTQQHRPALPFKRPISGRCTYNCMPLSWRWPHGAEKCEMLCDVAPEATPLAHTESPLSIWTRHWHHMVPSESSESSYCIIQYDLHSQKCKGTRKKREREKKIKLTIFKMLRLWLKFNRAVKGLFQSAWLTFRELIWEGAECLLVWLSIKHLTRHYLRWMILRIISFVLDDGVFSPVKVHCAEPSILTAIKTSQLERFVTIGVFSLNSEPILQP